MGDDTLKLTVALGDYDHVRDLVNGSVPVPGLELQFATAPSSEMFRRFRQGEWDVSEFGLGKYAALCASGSKDFSAVPVFPGRAFRQGCAYVRADSPLGGLGDLAGRVVGIPEWAQTAGVYFRGCLAHHAGVALDTISWVQAGVNSPGRRESVTLRLPPGVSVLPRPTRALDEMLLDGTLDAVVSAEPPRSFIARRGVRRLLADPRPAELEYYRATGVFPIMHVVAVRDALLAVHPWLAERLAAAFTEAKRRSIERIVDSGLPRLPLPFATLYAEESARTFGEDPWPYGIEDNRPTLEAFLGYAHEQGVTSRPLAVEDLFAPAPVLH